jgi:phenylacetate-CoA ligase
MTEAAGGESPLAGLPMHSTLAGARWPVFPARGGEAMLAMIWQFERTERLAPVRLQALQMVQAREVMRHAAVSVPFYQQLWRDAGLEPQHGTGAAGRFDPARDALTPSRYAQLPVVTRAMLQQAGDTAFSASLPADHGRMMSGETSGSTGRPLAFRTTELTQFMWRAFTLRDHLWHRRDLRGKLAAIRWLPVARAEESNWGLATAELCATGPAVGLNIDHDLQTQARWLIEQAPSSLISYASNLLALARWFEAAGVRLPSLTDLRSVAEVVTAEQRAACKRAFGVPLIDSYSTKELGYLALQCPLHEHYHVQSEGVLLELLDEHDKPVPAGATGRVVITSLHNFAMPFVRYDTGDYATAGGVCDCGRTLPVLTRIDGRSRNLMRLPDGGLRWPLCDLVLLPDVPGILQYQFVQHSVDAIEVRLVVDARFDRALESRLTQVIHGKLGHPFALSFNYLPSIARSAAGKYEDFINLSEA